MKPQLHASMLEQLSKCGEQFRRRYGARFGWNDREEILLPGVALITGKSVHTSIEKNLTAKIETGKLLPLQQVQDIARDTAAGEIQSGIYLSDEDAENPEKAKGDCIDSAITLARLHAIGLAPTLRPKSVERKWVVHLNGFPFDLSGQIDIETDDGAIRDTKTKAKTPSQDAADSSEQLSMYDLAKEVCDGAPPTALYLDALVKLKEPKIVTLQTTRSKAQRQSLLRRIERSAQIIEKGVFTPADSNSWVCSRKWCGYFATCPYFSGKP